MEARLSWAWRGEMESWFNSIRKRQHQQKTKTKPKKTLIHAESSKCAWITIKRCLKIEGKKDSRWSLSQLFDAFSLFNFKRQKSCNVRKKWILSLSAQITEVERACRGINISMLTNALLSQRSFVPGKKIWMKNCIYIISYLISTFFKCKWVLFQMQHAEFFCIENVFKFVCFFFQITQYNI